MFDSVRGGTNAAFAMMESNEHMVAAPVWIENYGYILFVNNYMSRPERH